MGWVYRSLEKYLGFGLGGLGVVYNFGYFLLGC